MAWLPKERILFAGDLCVNQAGNNIADRDADPDNWLRALDAMALMDIGRLVPGHGPLGDLDTIRGQRAYLADLIGGVRAAIQKGASDYMAKPFTPDELYSMTNRVLECKAA